MVHSIIQSPVSGKNEQILSLILLHSPHLHPQDVSALRIAFCWYTQMLDSPLL